MRLDISRITREEYLDALRNLSIPDTSHLSAHKTLFAELDRQWLFGDLEAVMEQLEHPVLETFPFLPGKVHGATAYKLFTKGGDAYVKEVIDQAPHSRTVIVNRVHPELPSRFDSFTFLNEKNGLVLRNVVLNGRNYVFYDLFPLIESSTQGRKNYNLLKAVNRKPIIS